MNNDLISKFNNDGFLIAKDLIDKNEIKAVTLNIKKTFDHVLESVGSSPGVDLKESMQRLFDVSIEKYLAVTSSLWRKQVVSDFLNFPSIRNYLFDNFGWRDIYLPGGQVAHVMGDKLKIPGGYYGISVHQDWPSVGGSRDGLVIWIPLMDVDQNNYPLEVIAGSHKYGMYPLKGDEHSPWEIDPKSYAVNEFEAVKVQEGDVIFMSYFTVHRTGLSSKGDGSFRIALSTRYDNADEESFIQRGYPTAYTRSVNRILDDK